MNDLLFYEHFDGFEDHVFPNQRRLTVRHFERLCTIVERSPQLRLKPAQGLGASRDNLQLEASNPLQQGGLSKIRFYIFNKILSFLY